MSGYTIEDIIHSSDRYKLYTLVCREEDLPERILHLQSRQIYAINIGKEVAAFIDGLEDFSYLTIDTFDFIKNLLDRHKAKISTTGNEVVAVYNLGILFEPTLELNATKLLKEFSKMAALIIIWEYQIDIPGRLHWPGLQNNICFDFAETQLKDLRYEV